MEVDSSIRKLLKGGRDLYDSLITAIIQNLKIVKDSSRVIVLDADGTRSKGIARSLRKIGVKASLSIPATIFANLYVVQGGFQSWTKQGIRIKELKPETALSILNEEAEAILEDVSPSPLQLLGYEVSVSGAGFFFSAVRTEERAATAAALCDPALFPDAIECLEETEDLSIEVGAVTTTLLIDSETSNSTPAISLIQENCFPIKVSNKEQFETIFTQARSEAASCPGGSESTSVDPINEEKLRNKSWIDAAGGITNRGRLYGVGKVGSALRLGDAFPNLSCGRSTQESEKILQLEQQVRQSREEARQSREEALQSREQNGPLQRQFESLFNAVLPLLPSDTQQLLQQQANMQPDNEDDQQPSSATGHYGNDY
ncbi:hypothetical protein Fmac_021018 [Flemingia macrophylla]|uniref:Rhodanese domain-containing protein n=1 Tax=Flemingia macrophylla TaxID=520843 RepID=A0ABD1LVU7_9FABA